MAEIEQSEETQKTASALKKIITGLIISEYGLIQIKDQTKQDLKARTNAAIKAIRKVEDHFKYHPNGSQKFKDIFEKEFLKSEILLMAELFETTFGIDEEGLEEIINAIKKSITHEQ